MNQPTTSARQIQALETSRNAIDLRLKGHNYRQIAKELGISEGGAHKAVKRHLEKLAGELKESAEDCLLIELQSLNQLESELTLLIDQQDNLKLRLAIVDRVLRIKDQRAKLLGLNAPVKVETTGTQLSFLLPLPPGTVMPELPTQSAIDVAYREVPAEELYEGDYE